MKQRRPNVTIMKARCTLCASHGKEHWIVIGTSGDISYRLSGGCKTTFAGWMNVVTDRNEHRRRVKKFWQIHEEMK